MNEMMSVGQYPGGSSVEHHCKDCRKTFESAMSLEVHLKYHQENLMNQWGMQAQQEESNNNNSKAGNHNSHVGHSKRESVTAPADSSEPSHQPSHSPTQQHPSAYEHHHFSAPMFSDPAAHFMFNEQAYLLSQHHYASTPDDAVHNGNYARYHPYQQHQQQFETERANSVSSTSPRSPAFHCDKCGNVFESSNQLADHVRVNHPNSPMNYAGPPQYQQLGGSPQQQQQQIHSSPPQPSQAPAQGYEYTPKLEIKDEEQAEILDLDSHKVQTHRYEEEMIRHHHQQQQQQQADLQMLHQQQQQMQRGAPHSVSSMLGWPPGQEYPGLSPMESVPAMPDQAAFMRSQMPLEAPRHAGSPIITSTQPMGQQIPALLAQPSKSGSISNQSWKSNEARRPKTYNCTACNKWFTSSGHLKRHYGTTLHKNAVKQSNKPDPAGMPISTHHHPGRDPHNTRPARTGSSRSPETPSRSPPNLMAGPLNEAARGLLRTPTSLYANSNSSSNSSDSAMAPQLNSAHMGPMQQQQQQQQQPMASPHQFPMASPGPLLQHQAMHQPAVLPQHTSPSMATHHHHMNSPSPIVAGVVPMASPPMGGTSMPQQLHPNGLPPHVTTTTSIPVMPDSISNPLTTIGDEITRSQGPVHVLPNFTTFRSQQGLMPCYEQYNGYACGQGDLATNVGGLSPEESIPQRLSFESTMSNYVSTFECVSNGAAAIQQSSSDELQPSPLPETYPESNNNIPCYQPKEEINPNVGSSPSPPAKKKASAKPKQEVSSEPHYISKEGFHMCLKCKKKFNKACYLTQHNKSFHCGEKPYKCNQCGKRYIDSSEYTLHLDKHAGEKPHKCSSCPKQFNHKTDLRRHECLHTGTKPYKCQFCTKGFIRKDHMVKHSETHVRKDEKRRRL